MLFVTWFAISCAFAVPLSHDVEGPTTVTESRLLIGVRGITNGHVDRHLPGEYAATFFILGAPPAGLSACMVDCAEDLSTSMSNSAIEVSEFDVSTRELRLQGMAMASEYEELLRTLQYTNRATNPNVDTFNIFVSDGAVNTSFTLPVTTVGRRRRRSVSEAKLPNPKSPLHDMKHHVDEHKPAVDEIKRAKRSPKSVSHVEDAQPEVAYGFSMWSLPAMLVFGSTVLLATAMMWIYQKKHAGNKDLSEA